MKMSECNLCPLCKTQEETGFKRTQVVLPSGNPKYGIMFIGEAPGEEEDKQGKPFVGETGIRIFNSILKSLGLSRSSIYLTNAVKCRPTKGSPESIKNRAPSEIEMQACHRWLHKEIIKFKPKIIIPMGNVAISSLMGIKGIMRHAGRIIKENKYNTLVVPILHPSSLLYDNDNRKRMEKDLISVKGAIREVF